MSDGILVSPAARASAEPAQLPEQLPQLDGARGVALLLVLAYHALSDPRSRFEWLVHRLAVAGWTGVDLFFVLSGFLITRILRRERRSSRYFSAFYARRILRIFPIYYAVLLVALVVAPRISKAWAATYGFGAIPLFTFTGNLLPVFTRLSIKVGSPGPLSHFWSLMVEEHFYLVWPFLVWRLTRRGLVGVCALSFVIAEVSRLALLAARYDEDIISNFTPCRIDTIAAGALLALLVEARGVTPWMLRRAAGVLVACSILLAVVAAHDTSLYHYGAWMRRFGYPVLALFWASGLLCSLALPMTHVVNRVLACRPLRLAGRYSYGAYVYHVPLLAHVAGPWDLEHRFGTLLGSSVLGLPCYLAFVTALIFAVAGPSYEFFEAPFLRLKRHFDYGIAATSVPSRT